MNRAGDALLFFGVGLLFGLGLCLSGMTNPAVVLGFLDVAGHWNPALGFVMGGALAVAFPAYQWARRSQHTLGGKPLTLPMRAPVTRPLVIGSAVFGIGWGLSGFCPGPAIVNLTTLHPTVLVFAAAMAAGAWLQRRTAHLAPVAARAAQSEDGEASCS